MNKLFQFSLFILFFLISNQITAQIINTESLRKVTDTSGWSGSINLNLDLKKNVSTIFRINNRIHIQYKNKKNLVLFMNDINYERFDGSSIISNATQHLRYNYKTSKKIALEAFSQSQFNSISKIDYRWLIGIGIRFKLSSSEKYKFYLGTLVMYEYEKSTDEIPVINKDLRFSNYFSFSLYPSDNVSIVSTTYYQPKMNSFKDFRISSESFIAISIYKNLGFKSSFNYYFDKFPVEGIPKSQYSFTNGLIYTFD